MSREQPPCTGVLTVTFHNVGGRSPFAWWEAVGSTRGRIMGAQMAIGRGRIPHDLGHMATEAHLGIAEGFLGLAGSGCDLRRWHRGLPGRPGRQLVRDDRQALRAADSTGSHHQSMWARGGSTPAAPTFDRLARPWDAIADRATLTTR